MNLQLGCDDMAAMSLVLLALYDEAAVAFVVDDGVRDIGPLSRHQKV